MVQEGDVETATMSADDTKDHSMDMGQNHQNAQREDELNPGETRVTLLIMVALTIFVVTWCFYFVYSGFVKTNSSTDSRARPTATVGSTPTQSLSLPSTVERSPRERKRLVMEYLDRCSNHMIVQHGDLLTVNPVDSDSEIESGNLVLGTLGDAVTPIEPSESNESQVFILRKDRLRSTRRTLLATKNTADTNDLLDSSSITRPSKFGLAADQPIEPDLEGHSQQIISDPCIICLELYQVGDAVLWSGSKKVPCPHVFHEDCFVEYLARYRGYGTPCPSCRQDYLCEDIFLVGPVDHHSTMTAATTHRSDGSNSSTSSTSRNESDGMIP